MRFPRERVFIAKSTLVSSMLNEVFKNECRDAAEAQIFSMAFGSTRLGVVAIGMPND